MLEDGFSVTQPDGLSRTDLIDPHASSKRARPGGNLTGINFSVDRIGGEAAGAAARNGARRTLGDLFEGRRQLIVYHFMFDPAWDEGCKSCSFVADNFTEALELRPAPKGAQRGAPAGASA